MAEKVVVRRNIRRDGLSVLKKKINDDHGRTIGNAFHMRPEDTPRVSTGSLSLDFGTGGGICIGRTSVFQGGESSGKTTTAIRVAGNAQDLCANCFRFVDDIEVEEAEDDITGEVDYYAVGHCDCYEKGLFEPIQLPNEDKNGFKARLKSYKENSYEEFRVVFFDIEGTFDSGWAKALGMDPRRVLIASPASAEEAVDLYDDMMRTGAVNMYILDSIAAMTPTDEINQSAIDWQQGLSARIFNKFIRKANAANQDVQRAYGHPPTHIWINQEREKIGVKFGDSRTVPGGNGQKFAPVLTLEMWSSAWGKDKFDEDLKAEWQMKMSREVRMNFKTKKNKTFTAKISGGYNMCIAGPRAGAIEDSKYVLAQAMKYGLLEEIVDGKKKTWVLGGKSFDKKASMLASFELPSTQRSIRSVLLKKMFDSVGD